VFGVGVQLIPILLGVRMASGKRVRWRNYTYPINISNICEEEKKKGPKMEILLHVIDHLGYFSQ
jgi:hypothetical protein